MRFINQLLARNATIHAAAGGAPDLVTTKNCQRGVAKGDTE